MTWFPSQARRALVAAVAAAGALLAPVAPSAAGPGAGGTAAAVVSPAPLAGDRVVGVAATADGEGYWLARASGRVDAFGTAVFRGDLRDIPLTQPVVGIAATASSQGYWLVAADGGIFTFGDAAFFGSTGAIVLNRPVVSMAPTPTGQGYWMVATDGGIFSFGDAVFHGSIGDVVANQPVNGITVSAGGAGYHLVAADGGVFSFGDAPFFGSTGAEPPDAPVVGMAGTPSGLGYWMVTAAGQVLAFGDAGWFGDLTVAPAAEAGEAPGTVVGIAAVAATGGYVVVMADGRATRFDPDGLRPEPLPPAGDGDGDAGADSPPARPDPPGEAKPGAAPAPAPGAPPDEPPPAPLPPPPVPVQRQWPLAWQAMAPAPTPRYEAASIVVGDRIYVFGGYRDAAWHVDRTYASYDPGTGTWTPLGTMPPGVAETHLGIATDGEHVYLAGGFAGDIRKGVRPSQQIADSLWRYHPATDTWEQVGTFPVPRGAGGLALVGRTLHYVGGNLADRVTNVGDHFTFDLDTRTWGRAAPMPNPKDHFSTVVVDGKIYVLGGERGHDELNLQQADAHVFDPATGAWTRLADLPVAKSHLEGGTYVADGRIVLAGGQLARFEPTAGVLAYDIASDTWTRWRRLPAERQGAAVHRVGATVVVALGALKPDQPRATVWHGDLS